MTTPFEAYEAMEKESFIDPISLSVLGFGAAKAITAAKGLATLGGAAKLGLTGVGTHVAANAVNLARDSSAAGSLSAEAQAARAAKHAVAGRITPSGRREAMGLAGGFEAQQMNYDAIHSATHRMLNHDMFGGDHQKAIAAMKGLATNKEFKDSAQHHPLLKNLQHAWEHIDGHTDMTGTTAYNPDSLIYKAKDRIGRMGAQGLAVGGGFIDPSILVHAGWNKARHVVGNHPDLGPGIAAMLAGKGLKDGRSTGFARHATSLLASPAVTATRDLGASIGDAADKNLRPDMAKSLRHRVGSNLRDVDALKSMSQFAMNTKMQMANSANPELTKHLMAFHDALTPETKSLGMKGVNAATAKAKQFMGTDFAKGKVNDVYQAGMGVLDARRGTSFGMRELKDDMLDKSVLKHLRPASRMVQREPDVIDSAQGALSVANKYLAAKPTAAPKMKSGPIPWGKYAVPAAAAGGVGIAGGALLGASQKPQEDNYYDKAAALDEITMEDIDSLGRFIRTPQPIRPRVDVQPSSVLSGPEALGRIMSSKNHQHHLNKKGTQERIDWCNAFGRRWVGDHAFHLMDVDLNLLRHKKVPTDPAKIHELVNNWPLKDDGNYPIIGAHDGVTPHVILDGNHRIAAAKKVGEKSVKAYVRDDVAPDFREQKSAYSCFTPVDLLEPSRQTPSFFPEDIQGHLLTSLRAAQMGDEDMLAALQAMRGHVESHPNIAIRELIMRGHK